MKQTFFHNRLLKLANYSKTFIWNAFNSETFSFLYATTIDVIDAIRESKQLFKTE